MATTSVDIASALGIGSGINTTSLVASLVSATREPKDAALNAKATTNGARISALASAKSSLTTFSKALTDVLKSTDYSGQPVSNDVTVASVSLIPGAGTPVGLPAQLEVQSLAAGQVLESPTLAAATATAGTGKLTVTVGSASYDVTLTAPKTSLDDLAAAITAGGKGVTASVVSDRNGARIVLKGETGADKAFTIAADASADADLRRFTFDGTSGGLTRRQTATNARITLDNVAMEFTSNTITSAVPNLRIDLNRAAPGTQVTLATNQPTSTMKDLVQEFVNAYNSLKGALNSATASGGSGKTAGALASDSGVRDMATRLAQLTGTQLATSGPYRTMADLGVSTNRDGTLTLNSTTLDKAIAADPAAVTQMLNPTVPDAAHPGIGGILKSATDYLNGANGPLASSAAIYDKMRDSITAQRKKLDESMDSYSTSLTKTYSAMQTRLLSLKATETYLKQQIAVWTNTDD